MGSIGWQNSPSDRATVIGLPVAIKLFAAAAVFYGIASASGEIAKDPPEPDPNFKEPVTVTPLPLAKWPAQPSAPAMEALSKLLDAAARIFALENARTVTRSRMLSAGVFGDERALELHRLGYGRIEHEMKAAASELDVLLPDVQAEVDANEHIDLKMIAAELDRWAASGSQVEMYDAFVRAGLAPDLARELTRLPVDDGFAALVKANGLFLIPFVGSLKRFVKAVESERAAVMSGEDACLRPPHRDDDDEDGDRNTSGVRPLPRPRQRCGCRS